MSKVALKKVNQQAAIDLMIHNPGLNKTEVAKQLDIPPRTIRSWFADDRFVDMYYKRYMTLFNSKLPMVLNSMIREAVEGNVMAGRLVLEHSGKLIKNINVTVDSPFEKFLKAKEIDADVIDAESEEVQTIIENLPERNPENDTPKKRNKKEAKKISYAKNKKQNKAKRYALLQRAKKVGLKPLPAKRPTHSERRKWLEKLSELEQATKSQTHQQ
jgi:hypothetical protein